MAKTVDITSSYIGSDITSIDIYDTWPGGTLLSGSYTSNDMLSGIRLTGIADSIFSFVLVDTVTSASSSPRDLPGPTISEFNPTSGTVGDIIGVTGSGFIGITTITLGEKNVTSFVTSSNTNMTLVVPADASGSDLLILSNPRGSFSKAGWQYTVGGSPVINPLGTFAYDINSNDVCSDTSIDYSLYTKLGTSIQQAWTNKSIVYIEKTATDLAPIGWYKELPSTDLTDTYIYYVSGSGQVVDRANCAASSGGDDTSGGGGGTTPLLIEAT